MSSKGWKRHVDDFPIHRAPQGIQYRKLSDETDFRGSVEIDYVPVRMDQPIPVHVHENAYSLCVVVAGTGLLLLNEDETPLSAGDVVYIPAGARHGFAAKSNDFAFLSVQHPPIGDDYIFPGS